MDTVRSPDVAAVVRNNIVVVKEITVDTTGIESTYMVGMSYNTALIMVKTMNVNQKGKKKLKVPSFLPPNQNKQIKWRKGPIQCLTSRRLDAKFLFPAISCVEFSETSMVTSLSSAFTWTA